LISIAGSDLDDDATTAVPELTSHDIMDIPTLQVGMRFANPTEFRWAVRRHSIYEGKEISFPRNKGDKVVGKCLNCSWRIYASWNINKTEFIVKISKISMTAVGRTKIGMQHLFGMHIGIWSMKQPIPRCL